MTTFTQILKQTYAEAPERVAVHLLQNRQPDVPITYRALLHGAAGYAQAFEAAGIQPGEVAVLILQHGEALLYAFWGAVLRGAIPAIMPFLTEKLSPDKYRQDLAALIDVTKPATIVTYPEFEGEVRAAMAAAMAATNACSVRAVVVSTAVQPAQTLDFATLPGLARSHRAVLNQVECYGQAIKLAPDDVVVSWLPLYHDMGLIASFVMPILSRVTLVLMSPFDWVRAPYKLLQAVSHYKGTLSWLPNFAYNFCAQKIRDRDLAGIDLSSWRTLINCSEPTYWSSHHAFAERFKSYGLHPEALTTSYAMAENTFAVTQSGMDGPVAVDEIDQRALITERIARPFTPSAQGEEASPTLKLLSSGHPLPNTRVRVLDKQFNDAPERHLGDIALQSTCMLTGYYHRDDATAKAFHDGWYLTGDLGYWAEGQLYVTGRKKDLIIVGGKNVYPQDLERLAADVPGVHPGRMVAFGVFSEEEGTEEVVIVAEVDTDDAEARQRIGDEIRQRIARGSDVTLRHAHIVGAHWLLKTSSGKTARGANRDKYLAEIVEQTD